MRAYRQLIPLITLAWLGASCASTGVPLRDIAADINATLAPPSAVLVPGDKLEVRFLYALEWNHEVLVLQDGVAPFVGVDGMQVAGLTLEQLDTKLESAYAELLGNPSLTVLVNELAPRSISVLGDVLSPSSVPFASGERMTLLGALARAGGHRKETARLSHTVLIRWDAASQRNLMWEIDARSEHWWGPDSILLQPHDVIYVPNKKIDRAAIWLDNHIRRMIPLPSLIRPY